MEDYSQIYKARVIEKIRHHSQSDDTESVHFVPEEDLAESKFFKSFNLCAVLTYEDYKNPLGRYSYDGPMVYVELWDVGGFMIMEEYEVFDKVMQEYIDKTNFIQHYPGIREWESATLRHPQK